MSPTTGSSGRGRSTCVLSLPPSSLCGLGGRSLQRDTLFLLHFWVTSPSQSLDLERDRIRLRPPSLSMSRPRSLCKGLSNLRGKRAVKPVHSASHFFSNSKVYTFEARLLLKSPVSSAHSTDCWHKHLQLLHGCSCHLLVFCIYVALWNLIDVKSRVFKV